MLRHICIGNPSVKIRMASLILILIGMASSVGGASPKAIDRRHFEIVGLTLFKDEMDDVQRKLGPAVVFHPPGSDFPERCYASAGEDRTALVLEDWAGTLVGFRIYRETPKGIEKCTRTPAVSSGISTAGGLKLGLTKAEVLKLLGTPTKTAENSIDYREDIKSAAKGKEGLSEYTDLEIRFDDAKAIAIHVVHTIRD